MAGGDLTGYFPNPVLANSGVVAGTYGSGSNVAQFTINPKGLLTVANNVPIAVVDSQISGFSEAVQDAVGPIFTNTPTLAWTYSDAGNTITADLINTGVSPGTYSLPIVAINAKGLITSISSGSISPAGHAIYEDNTLSPQRTFLSFFGGNFDLADDAPNSQTDVALSLTGVGAGSYGTSLLIPRIQVDSKGRITTLTTVSSTAAIAGHTIQEDNSSFTQRAGLSFNGTYFDVIDNSGLDQTQVTFGNSGINANTYGSNTLIPQIQFDIKGRALSASASNVSINSSNISNFVEAAQDAIGAILVDSPTIDFTYDDPGNTISADLFNSGVSAGTYQYSTVTVNAKGIVTVAANGVVSLNNTDGLPQGTTNLYYTDEKTQDAVALALTNTSDIVWTYNDPANTITADLTNTGIGAGSYGSASNIPQLTINTKGRFTAGTSLPISITATQVSDFTEAIQDAIGAALTDSGSIDFTYNDPANAISADLFTTGVGAGSYVNPTLTLDSTGRVTSISSNGLIGGHIIQEDNVSFTQRAGLSFKGVDFDVTDDSANNQSRVSLSTTGVSAGTYGNTTTIGTFSLGTDGRLTSAGTASFTKIIGEKVLNVASLNNPPGHGTTNTAIRWLNSVNVLSSVTGFTTTNNNASGFSCQVTSSDGNGIYMITYIDSKSSGSGKMGISLNSSTLTTTIDTIPATNRLAMINTPGAGLAGQLVWVGRLNVNDVVRMHTDGTLDASNTVLYFSIARLFKV